MAFDPIGKEHATLAKSQLYPAVAQLVGCKPEEISERSSYPDQIVLQGVVEAPTYEDFGVMVVKKQKQDVASFQLQQLPGCCGVALSYHAAVWNPLKKRGVGRLCMRWRAYISYLNGFRLLLCTTRMNATAQVKLLEGEGYKQLHTFNNNRTGLLLGVYAKDLTEADGRWDEKSKEVLAKKAGKTASE